MYISYAAYNHITAPFENPARTSVNVYVNNYNGFGGQSIYYAPNFLAVPNATAAFERALETWRCATFINYKVRNVADIPDTLVAAKVEFATLDVGVVTVLGITENHPTSPCTDPNGVVIGAKRPRFVIQFNSILDWHTDTLMPPNLPSDSFDLESRALHELGHAHLLVHTNNPNDLMYFEDVTPPYNRELQQNDLDGGHYIVGISLNIPANCTPSMIPLNPINCGGATSVFELGNRQFSVKIVPNPAFTTFELNIASDNSLSSVGLRAQLFTLTGVELFNRQIRNTTTTYDVSNIPAGVYILVLSTEAGDRKSFKIIKH